MRSIQDISIDSINKDVGRKPALFVDSCSLISLVQRRAEVSRTDNGAVGDYRREIEAAIWFRREAESGRVALLITKDVFHECARLLDAKVTDVTERVRADINRMEPHLLMGRMIADLRKRAVQLPRLLEKGLDDERTKAARMKELADGEIAFLNELTHGILSLARVVACYGRAERISRRVDDRLRLGLAPAHHGRSKNSSSDCNIIETVLEVAEELPESAIRIFLSANTSDFCVVGKRVVHTDLSDDFERVGLRYAHQWQLAKNIAMAAQARGA